MNELVALPRRGRRFVATRKVRLGDVGTDGRLRLDALARYLQDVAADDADDAGFDGEFTWVVRRVIVEQERLPRFGEHVSLTTFCSGHGSRWAERRTSVVGPEGAGAEAAALWVLVDLRTGRPAVLPQRFFELYGEAAGGRKVHSRLTHVDPPDRVDRRHWTVRVTDLDLLEHVNNAAYWEVVEDELARRDLRPRARRAELEYRTAVELHDPVEVRSVAVDDGVLQVWLMGPAGVHASATVSLAEPDRPRDVG